MRRCRLGILAVLVGLLVPASAHAIVRGDYLVVDQMGGIHGKLFVLHGSGSTTTATEVPTGGLLGTGAVAVAAGPDGAIYIVDQGIPSVGPGVWRLTPGSLPQVFSSGPNFNTPNDIAWNPVLQQFIVVDSERNGGKGGLIAVAPDGSNSVLVEGTNTVDPDGIAISSDGTMFVSDANAFADAGGGVFRFGPVSPFAESTLSQNAAAPPDKRFISPTGIALRPDGHLVVGEGNGGGNAATLIDVGPTTADATHNQSLIDPSSVPAPPTTGSGTPLDEATGLTYDGPDLLIADPSAPRPCWVDAGCASAEGQGALFRLTATNQLGFVGGGPASELNATFLNPTDITVMTNQPPIVTVSAPATAQTGDAIKVSAGASDPDGDALSYRFDNDGDGILDTSAGPDASYTATYDTPGTKVIGVEVTDGFGGVVRRQVDVGVSQKRGPVVASAPVVSPATTLAPTDPGLPLPPASGPTTPEPNTTVTLPPLSGLDLNDISAHGLTLTIGCTEGCDVTSELLIDPALAKKLHLSSQRLIVIGSGKASLGKAGKVKLKIKLTPKARRKLKAAIVALAREAAKRKIKLILRTKTKYRSGKSSTGTRKITLHA
ncbi:MAG: SMP-30/Gluconolactonase/LRE-like region [Thermoleophilaceae bacterium]|nr:SMP-30/Gluconolactonase/LRE-like region [Thermoleophilaceae bacterium]